MQRLFLALMLLTATAAQAAPVIVFAGSDWAAIDRGSACEAMTRGLRIAAKGQVQAIAGVGFTPDRRHWGEFRARLSRVPRPGSVVMLRIGVDPFLLVSRGNMGWSSGPLQQQAIIAALRTGGAMRIEGRDGSGRRFIDYYGVSAAPTAIDAAAARCAGKMQSH